MSNTNCLEGFKCPKCGSEGPFWIQATIYAFVLMDDEGTLEERETETTWDKDSFFRCGECGYEGEAKDFNPEMYREVTG